MSIATLRTAIATAVTSGTKVKTLDKIPDKIASTPVGVVFRNEINYDLYLGEEHGSTLHFVVKVYAGRITEDKAQEKLDALAEPNDPGSVKVAIESNAALRALVSSVRVIGAGPVMETRVGDTPYLTVDWNVEVEL